MVTTILKGTWVAVLLSAGLCGVAQAAEQSIDLGLSNHLFAADYSYELLPDATLNAGFMHSNKDDLTNDVFSVGFGVSGELTQQVRPRIGAKVFMLNGEHVDGHGLAANAGVSITAAPKLLLDFSGSYSPDIVTDGDIDNYYDLGFKVGYEIIPKGLVYAGYLDAQGARKGQDYEIYQGIVVGFKMMF